MRISNDSIREISPHNCGGGNENVRSEAAAGPEILNATDSTLAVECQDINGQGGIELVGSVIKARAGQDLESVKSRSKVKILAVMAALLSTLFLTSLNSTIVATAIPAISFELHSASGYAWIGGAYLLANATAAPVWVKLSDIWGRKPILLLAVGMYFITSIICAVSTTMKMLIIGRACQGTAGGGLMQLVNVTVSDLFSLRERSLYLGLLQITWAVAGGAGPVLGGLFTEFISWRWIFWINLPVSGIAFLLLLFFLDVHNPRTPLMVGIRAIDWLGTATLVGLMTMLLLGLDFGGSTFAWKSPTVIGLLIAGGFLVGCFLLSEWSFAKYPLIPLVIFSQRSNIGCLLIAFFHDFVYMAIEYYLPLFFQSVLLSTPVRSGILLLPTILTEAVTGFISGIVIHHTGSYLTLLYVGTIFLVIGESLFALISVDSSLSAIVSFQVIAGFGTGFLFSPPLLGLQANVKQEQTATATSTMGLVRNLSTCLSVFVGGMIFQNGMESRWRNLIDTGLSPTSASAFTGSEAAANVILIAKITDSAQRMAVQKAFAQSLRGVWILCAGMAGCAVLCVGLVVKKVLTDTHVEARTGVASDMK